MHSSGKDDKIKSAVEIALEKTSGMKATPEEIRALNEKELEARTSGLVAKYVDGEKGLKELEKELSKGEEEERGKTRSAMLKELLSSIELGVDNERAIEGLTALGGGDTGRELEELKSILQAFDLEHTKAEEQRSSTLLGELKARGVGGSALLPNLEDDEKWRAASLELRTAHEAKLDKLRAALLNTLLPGSGT